MSADARGLRLPFFDGTHVGSGGEVVLLRAVAHGARAGHVDVAMSFADGRFRRLLAHIAFGPIRDRRGFGLTVTSRRVETLAQRRRVFGWNVGRHHALLEHRERVVIPGRLPPYT